MAGQQDVAGGEAVRLPGPDHVLLQPWHTPVSAVSEVSWEYFRNAFLSVFTYFDRLLFLPQWVGKFERFRWCKFLDS